MSPTRLLLKTINLQYHGLSRSPRSCAPHLRAYVLPSSYVMCLITMQTYGCSRVHNGKACDRDCVRLEFAASLQPRLGFGRDTIYGNRYYYVPILMIFLCITYVHTQCITQQTRSPCTVVLHSNSGRRQLAAIRETHNVHSGPLPPFFPPSSEPVLFR